MEGDVSRESLLELIRQFREVAEIKDRSHFFKSYPQCFVGTQVVHELVERHFAKDEAQAVELGNLLMRHGYFHHVTRDHEFKNQKLFYRFSENDLSHGVAQANSHDTWKRLVTEGRDQVLLRLEDVADHTDWIEKGGILPELFFDMHNAILMDNTRPARWIDPTPHGKYNMIAIGGGAAGLVTAAGTSNLGGKSALIERNLFGGDCLNTGCVPSKALLRSAQAVHHAKNLDKYGVRLEGLIHVDFPAIAERLRKLRSDISYHDSCKRFTDDFGVDVFLGQATFMDKGSILVNGQTIRFSKCCIAVGGRPRIPMINGIERVQFYTSETIFNLTALPPRMIFLGAGPVNCELAQAFARFGSEVTIITQGTRVLSKEELKVSELIESEFVDEGITIIKNSSISIVEKIADGDFFPLLKITLTGGTNFTLECEALMIGCGRVANTEGLGLENAGVEFNDAGIKVNDFLQTTNGDIYAAGDCATSKQFTHSADAMARIVLKNSLFFGRSSFASLTIPRVTYTDPEVAVTGFSLAELEASGTSYKVFEKPFTSLDRAIVDSETKGFIKIYCKSKSDDILGAVIVGPRAGEVINELTLAITQKIGLQSLASVIHPYPSYGEAVKALADMCKKEKLSLKAKILMRELLGARR
mmetsp:Transcript_26475/g.47524  ORF Transcript_26475/g.47524 Transcript_26475/m.47524 type:complete len:644 (+) Transcript_26475:175-2106(+)